jgi:hypothetical protein
MFFSWLRSLRSRFESARLPRNRRRPRTQAGARYRLGLELLEDRLTPSTVTWVGSSGDWNTGTNWSNGVGPGAGDDAVINTANITVHLSTNVHTVQSVTVSNGTLSLEGGALKDTGNLQVSSGAACILHAGDLANATVTSGSKLTLTNYGGTLSGVTVAAGATVDGTQSIGGSLALAVVYGGLTLNGEADLGSASGDVSGRLYFQSSPGQPSQTLGGSGKVVFGGSASNALYAEGLGGTPVTLTLASGITVQGGSGIISGYDVSTPNNTIVNQGAITVGSSGTLTIGGFNWVNNGTITATNATVNLGGSFTTAHLGSFSASGSTVNLTGSLDNANATLALAPALGAWRLDTGFINHGTISSTGGSKLALTGYGGMLVGVTVAAGATVDGTQSIGSSQPHAYVSGGLTLKGEADLGSASGDVSGQLWFQGSSTLGGSGKVVFGGSASNALYAYGNGGSTGAILTLASGITVQGGSGIISGEFSKDSIVNNATITVGSSRTLTVGGLNWVNNGTITATNATVNLGGSFTTAHLGSFSASGSTVNLTGALDNSSATLALAPALGAWQLHGGSINGGTISSTGGSKLALTGYGGTLTGVTVAAGVTVDGTQSIGSSPAFADVSGGLTLNGEADLGSTSGNVYGQLFFQGSQTLGGSGKVVFGGSASNALYAQGNGGSSPATLTLASGFTVQGGSGIISGYNTSSSSDSIVNQGAITGGSSGTLTIGGVNWVNNGTIAANGGSISVGNSWTNNGTVLAQNGGLLSTPAFSNAGSLTIDGASSQLTSSGNYTQTGGSTTLKNGGTLTATSSTVNIQGGTLAGTGTINGALMNGSIVSPGAGTSAGVLTINGSYTQTSAATLNIKLGGLTAGTNFDQLVVSGLATLGGTLNVTVVGGFTPAAGNTFQILPFGSSSGDFATRTGFQLGSGLFLREHFHTTDLTLEVFQGQLVFQQQPSNTTPGQAITPAVKVAIIDPSTGNSIAFDNTDTVTVAIGNNPGGGTLSGTLTVTVSSGVATFSDLSINQAGSGYTLAASSTGLSTVASNSFAINAANNHLVFNQQPSNTVAGQSMSPALTVAIVDQSGNVLTGDNTDTVTMAIGTNPSGGTLSGTLTVTVSSGVATFSDLSINKAGSGYTLAASSTGLSTVASSGFAINPAAADHLVFNQQPSDTVAGQSMSPAVTVAIVDQFGNVLTADTTDTVTLAISNNPGGGTLSGTLTVTVNNGVATFSDLSIDKAGSGYTLVASSSGLTGATSSGFAINPAAADHVVFLQQPTNTSAGQTISPAVTVAVVDQFGNVVTSDSSDTVTVAIGTNPSSGTLSGTLTVTVSNGVATFGDLSIDMVGDGYTLNATATGLTAAVSNAFSITL